MISAAIARAPPLSALFAILAFASAFSIWTYSSPLAFPHFLAAVGLLFVLPGVAICRLCRLDLRPLELLAIGTALGLVTTSALYALLAWMHLPGLLWVWLASSAIGAVASLRAALTGPAGRIDTGHAALPLAVLAACVPMAVIGFYYPNLATGGGGGLSFAPFTDLYLHASIASELTHTIPPQVPFMAGIGLNYHVGMDLVTAVLSRFGGLAVPDLMVRFSPTLFITLDVLAAFCLMRRVTGSGPAAVAGALLATVGEDFSFIPGWLTGASAVWSDAFFRAPSAFSMYWLNPLVMNHGILFAAFFCLQRAAATREARWAVPFAVLCASLVEIKVFSFIHLALGLAIASAVLLIARRGPFLLPGILAAALSLPLVAALALANLDAPTIEWTLRSAWPRFAGESWGRMGLPWVAGYAVPATIGYLVLVFGFRIVGLPAMVRSIRHFASQPFEFFVAVFVIIGAVLTLGTTVLPAGATSGYNDSVWFLVGAKHAATIFAVIGLVAIWRRAGSVGRSLMVPLVAVSAFASTAQMVSVVAGLPAGRLGEEEVLVIGAARAQARPGDVVLAPDAINPGILTLTALRVPFHQVYARSFASAEEVGARRRALTRFWQGWTDRGRADAAVLARYDVRWIIAPARDTPERLRDPQCTAAGMCLARVYENGTHILFRVDGAPVTERPPSADGPRPD